MNTIRVFDYLEQYHALRVEILAAVERVLRSGQLILGPEGRAFEEEFATFLGGGVHCIGVNSGTDALAIALRALEVQPGDEVVTVANTAVPTVSAIRMVGARPVFCEVDPATALMSLSHLPSCITPRTRVILPVHLYGNVVDVAQIREIIGSRPIWILEDCAQAHGAAIRGRAAGTLGDAAAFSFYPTKNLGAYGDAGICVTADAELARRMRMIRMYGFEGRYYSEMEGVNSRLDEIQAAILRVKLKHLPEWLARRRELAALYDQFLPEAAARLQAGPGVTHAYHLYVVNVPKRDEIRATLKTRSVDTAVHYPWPIHLMRAYAFLGYKPGSLPNTERLADSVLSLPLYPEMPKEKVLHMCAALREVLA